MPTRMARSPITSSECGAHDATRASPSHFLTIDIGGSGLKAAVVDRKGQMIGDRVRVKTPHPCPPDVLLGRLLKLVAPLAPFDCVAVGFPGVVRDGTVVTAPNLGTDDLWGFDLATALAERLGRPVRVANDAEIQGLAAIEGEGLEMIITLGTGFGTALFEDGRSLPHLELAHHPFHKGKTYEQLLGKKALQRAGLKKWNRALERAIHTLRMLVYYDRLYIGGGNARKIGLRLDGDTTVVSNKLGVKGGLALWLGKSGGRAGRAAPPIQGFGST